MAQRGFLLALAVLGLGALLLALRLDQSLQKETVLRASLIQERDAMRAKHDDDAREVVRLKASAADGQSLALRLQDFEEQVSVRLDAFEKAAEKAAQTRDLAVQAGGSALLAKLGEAATESKSHLGELKTTVGEIKTALGEVKSQAASQVAALTAKVEELAKSKELAGKLTSQVAALEAKIKDGDAQLKACATDRTRQLEETERWKAEAAGLRKELDAERKRAASDPSPAARIENRPPPDVPVVTSVEAVEASTGVVVLGAGKKSGLEVGHLLSVTRDGRPVGRVRVIRTYDDLAGAEVVETAPGETLARNDRATTAPSPASPGPQSPPRVAPPLPGAGVVEGK